MKVSLLQSEMEHISKDERNRLELMWRVSSNISDALRSKGLTQRQFAKMMGKRESEVCRWLGGFHNFTLSTIADISSALDCDILRYKRNTLP